MILSNLRWHHVKADSFPKEEVLEFFTNGTGKLEVRDPLHRVLGITGPLNSMGIEDVYDLDQLEIKDSLFQPFQPMELISDFWLRVHLVKYRSNPDAVFAFQYSSNVRPMQQRGPSKEKWLDFGLCIVQVLPDRRSCDFTTCHCQGSQIVGSRNGRHIEHQKFSLFPDTTLYPRPR